MNLTEHALRWLQDNLPLENLLPTRMPRYVNSLSYLFGASALSALLALVVTGLLLCLFGPGWYHGSRVGHFVNSLHFWSVQVFFGTLLMHMLTKFLMAAWRDGRWRTWLVGALAFGLAGFTGLTGFLLQGNWDAQWIAVQAKDAVNALGGGSLFNPMNTGQVLTLHVVVLPLVIGGLVGLHLYFIRRDGPVKPL
jgi:quinol-cytochrome oxidoreductase complex cytochrome b subunit